MTQLQNAFGVRPSRAPQPPLLNSRDEREPQAFRSPLLWSEPVTPRMRKPRPTMRDQLRSLINTIVADNRAKALELLKEEDSLALGLVSEGHYENRIAHWIYAGDTALHVAAAGHRVEIAKMLLDAGADVNTAWNHLQSRPLHYAADGDHNNPFWDAARQVAMLQLLLDAGAVIDAPDKNSATALHHAVRNRCLAAVKCLLAAGADVTAKNKSGGTPFHVAVQSLDRRETNVEKAQAAQREIIVAFLEHGVSASLPDAKGKTVTDTARSAWIRQILSSGGK